MYSKSRIINGIKNPRHAVQVLVDDSVSRINQTFSRVVVDRIREPSNIFKEDWDNLLILDACTNELLQEYEFDCDINTTKWSAGSHTVEFMQRNLNQTFQDDVVWITANPQVAKFEEQIFEVKHVWDQAWDDDLNTVHPEELYKNAIRTADEYSNKRLVIHFIQPHYPFIGEIGQSELPAHASLTLNGYIENEQEVIRIWEQLRKGDVSEDIVREAYKENLEITLPYVYELIDRLEGKTVLTSDHGNEFGNRGFPIPVQLFGHPQGYRTRSLTCVPWIIFNDSNRKNIKPGDTAESKIEEDEIENQLKYLGYK
jgi:hypothetical protein